MVEGHSVHRLASRFRTKLVGRRFTASSPNGRFTDGAAAIDGKELSRMEAVGKNLFAFFSSSSNADCSNGELQFVCVWVWVWVCIYNIHMDELQNSHFIYLLLNNIQ